MTQDQATALRYFVEIADWPRAEAERHVVETDPLEVSEAADEMRDIDLHNGAKYAPPQYDDWGIR